MATLCEQAFNELPTTVRVDKENYIIHDVAINNERSLHKRIYPLPIRTEMARLMEGMPIGHNHPLKDRMNPKLIVPHKPDEILGRAYNLRATETGIKGDVQLLKTKEFNKTLMEAAEVMPAVFGMSVLIDGDDAPHPDQVNNPGWRVVTRINKCRYVDLVCEPATTFSLFESESVEEEPAAEEDRMEKHAGALHHTLLNHLDDYHPHLGGHGDHEKLMANMKETLKSYHKTHHKDAGPEQEESKEESKEAESKAESATPLAPSMRKYPVKPARTALPPTPPSNIPGSAIDDRKKRHEDYLDQLAARCGH